MIPPGLKTLEITHEDYRLRLYKCPANFNTIGIGHNCDANPLPQHIQEYLDANGEITDDMVMELFEADVAIAMAACQRLYQDFDSFSDRRRLALLDFVFNVGEGTAKTFIRTNRAINAGEWAMAAENMRQSLWFRQVKKRGVTITKMIEEG